MRKLIPLILLLFIFPFSVASAQCVDFDGDGRPDACGSTGNVPMPSSPRPVDTGTASSSGKTSSASPTSSKTRNTVSRTVHSQTKAPSTDQVVANAFAGAIFGAMLNEIFSPSQPAGPTPEQLEAQRRLEEQKRIEFLRSNAELSGRLKGSALSSSDGNMSGAGDLKLKSLPPPGAVPEVHSGFFGQPRSGQPQVQLLREPVAEAGEGLLDHAEYVKAVSDPGLTQEERERLFLRTKVSPTPLEDHPMVDARALMEKERWTDPYLDVAAAAARGGVSTVGVAFVEEKGKRFLKMAKGGDAGFDELLTAGKMGMDKPVNPAEAVIAVGEYALTKAPSWTLVVDGAVNAVGAGTRQAIVRYWAAKDSREYYDPTPVATAKEKWNAWFVDRNDCTKAILNRIGAGEFKE